MSVLTGKQSDGYPEENVLGGVEARGVDPCRVRRVSLADDAARKAGDGALNRLTVSVALTAGHRVGHHKVDGILCGTADLEDTESSSVNAQALCECT